MQGILTNPPVGRGRSLVASHHSSPLPISPVTRQMPFDLCPSPLSHLVTAPDDELVRSPRPLFLFFLVTNEEADSGTPPRRRRRYGKKKMRLCPEFLWEQLGRPLSTTTSGRICRATECAWLRCAMIGRATREPRTGWARRRAEQSSTVPDITAHTTTLQ